MSQQQHGTASGTPPEPATASYSQAGATAASGDPAIRAPGARQQPPDTPGSRQEQSAGRELPLPRVRTETVVTPGGTERTRSLGVHSILNPPQSELHSPRRKRRSISQVDSPAPLETESSYFPQSSDSNQSREDISPTGATASREGGPRRILSPRSHSVHRTASISNFQPPTGTIDAHRSPFLPSISRTYSSEAGPPGATLLPTPPIAQQHQAYPFPSHAPTPPLSVSRRPSFSRPTQSASASPSSTYSTFSQMPPATPFGASIPSGDPYHPHSAVHSRHPSAAPTPPSLAVSQPALQGPPHHPHSHPYQQQIQHSRHPHPATIGVHPSASSSATAQSAYQLMTVDTHHGPIQVPVDVQAASRVADEKRKRNAGASARFRQRRKQKEQQANQTISRLEAQLRHAEEDADFYKRERDFLRDVVWNSESGSERERLFPRPESPRLHREALPQESLSSGDEGESSVSGGQGTQEPEALGEQHGYVQAERGTRRRTSIYGMGPRPGEAQAGGFAPGAPPVPGIPPQHQQQQQQQQQQHPHHAQLQQQQFVQQQHYQHPQQQHLQPSQHQHPQHPHPQQQRVSATPQNPYQSTQHQQQHSTEHQRQHPGRAP